jgi:two-component system, NarL family, nitrate/nitrite response regulator NarL
MRKAIDELPSKPAAGVMSRHLTPRRKSDRFVMRQVASPPIHEILATGNVRFLRDGIAAAVSAAYPGVHVRAAAPEEAALGAPTADLLIVELDEGSATVLGPLRAVAPRTPILGLVLRAGPEVVAAAAVSGIRAFVSPSQPLSDIVAAVPRAARGEAICPPAVAALLLDHLSDRRGPSLAVELTAREREVAALVVKGMSNKEIAVTLVVEPATVKNHVHNILRKLHVRRRGEAAALLH